MDIHFEQIVEEVLRRYEARMRRRQVLLILKDGTNWRVLEAMMALLQAEGVTFRILNLLTREGGALAKPMFLGIPVIPGGILRFAAYEEFLEEDDAILVSELRFLEMLELKELRPKDTAGGILFTALFLGKPAYALCGDFLRGKNPPLMKKMKETLDLLHTWGLRVLNPPKAGAGKPLKTVPVKTGVALGGYLTKAQIMNWEGEQVLPKNLRLTPEAEDHLRQKGVKILRDST